MAQTPAITLIYFQQNAVICSVDTVDFSDFLPAAILSIS